MTNFLEITGVAFVVGKDETGADLALTRVSWSKFEKSSDGTVLEDGKSEGSTLFVGSLDAEASSTAMASTTEPDVDIKIIVKEGVVAK